METTFTEPTKLECPITKVRIYYNPNDVQAKNKAEKFFYSESIKKMNRQIQNLIHPLCGW